MDLTAALEWTPPADWHRLSVVESHTGGEPFRVVIDGLPAIPGNTVLERRRYAQTRLDHLRKAMMWEPRGHSDMYGGWPGPPTSPNSDISVLFVHNEGFSTMCGHGIIALSKVALETGLLPASEPETTLRIDTPAGLVVATSTLDHGQVSATRFFNVPSFTVELDARVDVPGFGEIVYDLAFGGAFYAIVDAAQLGLSLEAAPALVTAGRAVKQALVASGGIEHPLDPDLGFVYGVIFTENGSVGSHSRNVCVFADGEVDRSPTGTGVSARLAAMHTRGEIAPDESLVVESIVGSQFKGRIAGITEVGGITAIIPEIEGSAYLTGRAELWLDPNDTLGGGFLVR
ncbi:MAG TPA: proline racemase family protein [Acidimicrobiia bacterium]|nr:proline racemase family protein [Acidimicrobiia bacterium]